MTKILAFEELNVRPFGDELLSVPELMAWAKENKYTPPSTLNGYDFVQIETLLNAVMREVSCRITIEQAEKRVGKPTPKERANPHLLKPGEHTKMFPQWAVAGAAHVLWRKLITDAIESGLLTKYDGVTLFPIAAKAETAKSEPLQNTPAHTKNWIMQIQAEAARRWHTLKKSGASPTRHNIKDDLAAWCRSNKIVTTTGIYPNADYIYRHALRNWSPPEN